MRETAEAWRKQSRTHRTLTLLSLVNKTPLLAVKGSGSEVERWLEGPGRESRCLEHMATPPDG